MSDANHRPPADALDRATRALRDAPVPPGPPPGVLDAAVAAVHNRLAGAVSAEAARHQRRRRIMRYVRYGSAATVAAGLLVAVGVLWVGGNTAEASFLRAVENATKAKSMRAVVVTETGGMKFEMKMYVQGDAARNETDMGQEMGSFVVIVDAKQKQMLQLFPKTKTAIRTPLAEVEKKTDAVAKDIGGLANVLSGLKGAKVAALPDEMLDGRKLKVFTVKGHRMAALNGTADVTAWIDPRTELPVRHRMEMKIGDVTTTSTTTFLGFNEELDPKLFALAVPEGYTVTEARPDAPKPAPQAKPGDESPDDGETVFIAFQRAVDNAAKATSVREVSRTEENGRVRTEVVTYHQGGRSRTESGDILIVVDTAARKRLEVNKGTRYAGVRTLTDAELKHSRNYLDHLTEPGKALRMRKEGTVRELPADAVNGRPAKVYQIDTPEQRASNTTVTVWVDAQTERLARVRIERETEGLSLVGIVRKVKTATVREYDRWNEAFDEGLFSLEVPEGYEYAARPLEVKTPSPRQASYIAFRTAVEKAETAKSFRALVRTRLPNAPGGAKDTEQRLYGQGDKVRIELGDTVTIADGAAKKMMLLDTRAKVARTAAVPFPPGGGHPKVAAAVKTLLDKVGAEDLGERFLDGRKTRVYRVKGLDFGAGKADVTYWVDAKRDVPVRFELAVAGGPAPMTQTIDYLGFDEDLDPKLFDLTVPEGYRTEDLKLPGLKPGEKQ